MRPPPNRPLTVALLQAPQVSRDVAGNLARIDRAAQDAAAQGAQLLVTPEMFLTGYDIGAAQVQRLAEAADGPAARAVAEIARRHGIALAHGYPERAGDAVFNAAQLVDAQGMRLANYRKQQLYGELDRSMFTAGASDCPVVALHGWRLAMLICYDIEFAEPARRLAANGADLILVPTANMVAFDDVPLAMLPARARDECVAIAYANCVGREGAQHYGGLSVVVAAGGDVVAQAGRDEALIVATLPGAPPSR